MRIPGPVYDFARMTTSPTRGRLAIALALALIVLSAFALRAIRLPPTLVSGDDAITPDFVLDAWPDQGAGLSCFTQVSHRGAGNPLRLFAFHYGWVLPVCAFLAAAAWNLFGWPINEVTWAAPQLLAGSLTPLAVYFLVRRLSSPAYGLLAALSMAVIPIHVLQSRGLCPGVVLSFLLQVLFLTALLRYLEAPGRGRALVAGGLFFLYMNSHPQWMAMVPLTLAVVWLGAPPGAGRLSTCWSLLKKPALWALPALGLAAWVATGVAVGGPLKHLLHKGGRGAPGIYIGFWLWVLIQSFGPLLAALSFGSTASALARLRGLRLLPLAWAAVYSLPFIFFIGPGATIVETYIPHGQQALLLGVPVLLWSLPSARWRRLGVNVVLAGCMWAAAATAVTAWGLPGPVWLHKQGYTYRCYLADPGYKAAGLWVREHAAPEEGVHTFAFGGAGYEPWTATYYCGRMVGGLTDEMLEDASKDLLEHIDRADYIVVQEQDLGSLPPLPAPYGDRAIFVRGETPVLRIIQRNYAGSVDQVDVQAADQEFDSRYGSLRLLGSTEKLRKAAGLAGDW